MISEHNLDKYIKLSIGDFEDTAWLKNQPEGLIYAGKSMVGYSGKTTEKIFLLHASSQPEVRL